MGEAFCSTRSISGNDSLNEADCARKEIQRDVASDIFRKRLALDLSPGEDLVFSGRLTGLIR